MRDLGQGVVNAALRPLVADLRRTWKDNGFRKWLDSLEGWLLDNLQIVQAYVQAAREAGVEEARRPKELEVLLLQRAEVQREDNWDCPVVFEANPDEASVFGEILPPDPDGPRLAHLQAGSLLRADGGYLLLRLLDLRDAPSVWARLKRVLKTGRLEVRPVERGAGQPMSPLKPDPVEVNVKVVLIGEPGTYELLAHEDPDFRKVFKIHAEFDQSMDNTAENRGRYAAVVAKLAQEETLPPAEPCGLARVAEFGARLAGSRRRLSTRFGDLADLYREAAYLSRRRAGHGVAREDVVAAERARRKRTGLPQDKFLQAVTEGRLRFDVSSHEVGAVNGLVVLDSGLWSFGRPSRISAQVGVGSEGVVDIEREVELSGPIHQKGVQILDGYLLGTFATKVPLRLSAKIAFEQSYGGVDGDSASSTELYALLSALSGVPIDQGIAVTGSVDQSGRVQTVGGVNEKIEGFFTVCKELGLTGRQGCMIPAANVDDLMLRPEVLEAVESGQFRIWAVADIATGIEILTGEAAGSVDEPGTVLGKAAARLIDFARIWKENN